jgi:uncharacterized FAD-dependent dehydrogenase
VVFPGFNNKQFADTRKIISVALLNAFKSWEEDYPLFVSGHAILLGAETGTSSPVRIIRSEKYESVNIKNLYP